MVCRHDQLAPLLVGLCHLSAPFEWVSNSKEFKTIYNRPPKNVGDAVLLSFLRNPEFLDAGYFFTDPYKTYYRGRRCAYADAAAARAHLRVGDGYASQFRCQFTSNSWFS